MQTINTQTITIDIRKRSLSTNFVEKENTPNYIPQFVQGDTNILEAVIKDGGIDADLSDVGTVVGNFKRKDGVKVSRSATVSGNVVTYTLGNEEMAKSGIGELELQFYNADDTERISTLRFKVNVMAEIGIGLEGEDGPTLVQELVFNGQYAKQAADSAITNWLPPVADYSAVTSIAAPKLGDTVQTNDTGYVYRYENGSWKNTQQYGATALANVNAQLAERVKKGEVFISSKDFNLTGDGIKDDSVELQAAFDAAQGNTLILEKNKVYGIPNEKTVYIKSNTNVITNGAKFKKLTTGSNYVLVISGSNVNIDRLNYIPFSSPSETGVKISGSNINLQEYDASTETAGTGGDSTSRNALYILGESLQMQNIKIGTVKTKNWERAVQIRNVSNVEVGFFDIQVYKQAVYIRDVQKGRFNGAHIRTTSTSADGDPGENGVLIESTIADNSSRNITFRDWLVEDSAEHGYRIGGQLIASDITFENCKSRKPGRGKNGNGTTEAGIGHGGCGFKVLGPTSNSNRHRNIRFINCISEDGRTDVPVSRVNFAGFQIGKCINVSIENPIVRTNGSSVTDRSFVNGIEIIGSEDVTISNPNIGYTLNNGIHFYDADTLTGDFGSLLSRVNVIGGTILNPVNAGIYIAANNYTFRRLKIAGILLDTGTSLYAIQAVKSGSGSFSGCSAEAYMNPSITVTGIDGLDSWMVNLTGIFTNTPNNAANGSTYRATDGTFKIRKSGAWVNM